MLPGIPNHQEGVYELKPTQTYFYFKVLLNFFQVLYSAKLSHVCTHIYTLLFCLSQEYTCSFSVSSGINSYNQLL